MPPISSIAPGAAWPTAKAVPALAPGALQLWLADLDAAPAALERHATWLSPEESARAARFRQPRDRARWMMARGILRAVLAAHLAVEPSAVVFAHGRFGKPSLEPTAHPRAPGFNLSHSGGVALIAVGPEEGIGVDVELQGGHALGEELIDLVLAPAAAAQLRALPAAAREAAFLAAWTRKEAYLKALGLGLSMPLAAIDLPWTAGWSGCLGDGAQARWVGDLDCGPGVAAALACAHPPGSLACWRWPGYDALVPRRA